MPELPEVETIKLGLQKKIIGLKISKIIVLNPKSLQADPELLKDKKILKIERLAKILKLDLDQNISLLIHLKMSGQLIWEKSQVARVKSLGGKFIGGHPTKDMKGQMPNKSTRVIFELQRPSSQTLDSRLYFNDQRKFGWIKGVDSRQLSAISFLRNLGPEPLSKSFTWQLLKEKLQKRKNTPIKVAIMDQQIISGIGNIYASEACFLAKIDPRTKVNQLSDLQIKKLHQGIIITLKGGIKYGGSTRGHYVSAEGKEGKFLSHNFVYNKDKIPCKICGTKIMKIKLGGRGTFYCPNCQKPLDI